MAEEGRKTPEEELVDKVKDGEGASGGGKTEKTNDADVDNETPEAKLIKELTGKLTASQERLAKVESERDSERIQKDTFRKEAKTAQEKSIEAHENAVRNAMEGAKGKFESAKRNYREAYDSGDADKLIDAQTALNDAQAELRGAEFNSTQFKTWKEKGGGKVVSGGSNFTSREQAWIDKNPRFNTDPLFRGTVYAAHDVAVQKGIEIDSDDYFNHIESSLKEARLKGSETVDPASRKEEPQDSPKHDNPPPKKNDKQSTAAPPNSSGGNSSGGGSRKTTFTMTSEHRRAAQINFPDEYRKDPKATEEKYARLQLEIQDKKARGEL